MSRLTVPLLRAPAEGELGPVRPRWRGRRFEPERAWLHRITQSRLARPAVVGFVGTSLASMAATHPGGFFLSRSEPWLFRVPPFTAAPQDAALIAFYIGVVLLIWAWLAVVRATRAADGPTVGPVIAVMAIWSLPLLVGPPLFSGDVFVYAADGQLVSHGINPYANTAYALGPSPFRSAAHGLWLHTVSPYGPLFQRLAGVASTVGLHTVVGTVIVFRLMACAGIALCAPALCAISRRHGQRPAHVLALALLSPLTLLQLVSAGHNDAIMIGLLAAGVAVAGSGRPMTGIVLCTLAAAVKLPAAVAIVFIVWSCLRDDPSVRARISVLARGGAAALGTLAAVTAASGLGWGWLGALGVPGVAAPRLAIVNDLAFGFDKPLHLSFTLTLHIMRDLGMVVALAAVAYLLLRRQHRGGVLSLGAALVVVAVLGPTFYPWYLTWGLMFVAAAAADRWERAIVWSNTVLTFVVAPGGEGWLDQAAKIGRTWVARAVVGAVVAACALTAWRPERVIGFFRRPSTETPRPDTPPQLGPAPLLATANGSTPDGAAVTTTPSTETADNEEVMS